MNLLKRNISNYTKIDNFQTFEPNSQYCPTRRGLRDINYYKRECMATYTRSMFGAIFGTIFRCIGVCDAIQCLLFVYNDFNSSRPASYTWIVCREHICAGQFAKVQIDANHWACIASLKYTLTEVASPVMQLMTNEFINEIVHYILYIYVEKIMSLLNDIYLCKH